MCTYSSSDAFIAFSKLKSSQNGHGSFWQIFDRLSVSNKTCCNECMHVCLYTRYSPSRFCVFHFWFHSSIQFLFLLFESQNVFASSTLRSLHNLHIHINFLCLQIADSFYFTCILKHEQKERETWKTNFASYYPTDRRSLFNYYVL